MNRYIGKKWFHLKILHECLFWASWANGQIDFIFAHVCDAGRSRHFYWYFLFEPDTQCGLQRSVENDEIDVEIDSLWCALGGQRQRGNYREKLFIPSPNITLRMRLEQKYLFVCKKNQWKCLVDEKCKMKNAISSKRSSDSIDWPKHSECVLHENINKQTQ